MATKHQLFKNNADSTINGTVAVGATFFNVAPGHGTRFPTPSANEYFLVTLFEKNVSGEEINFEIVKCTAVTGDTLTIVRDFEGIVVGSGGTSGGWAYPSAVGINPSQITYVQLRLTAYGAGNSLAKDGNLEGLESAATARGNLGISAANTPNTPAGNLSASNVQAAINELDAKKVQKTSDTGSAKMPVGTTAQRDGTPGVGWTRFNTTLGRNETWNGTAWEASGGASGGNNDAVFYENDQTVTADYTVTSGKNAISAGPITVADGVTVTISDGSVWSIV